MTKITTLPTADALDGSETVPAVQDGKTVQAQLGAFLSPLREEFNEALREIISYLPTGGISVARSVSQYGMTLNLAEQAIVGEYANGDRWIIGPVSVQSAAPASAVVSGNFAGGAAYTNRAVNGLEINPGNRAERSGDVTINTSRGWQGYDSGRNSTGGTATLTAYDAAYNLDPGRTGAPLNVATGSIVKTISNLVPPDTGRASISDMAVFTVVDKIPQAGSFRPGVSSSSVTPPFHVSDLDLSVFKKLTPPANAPTPAQAAALVARAFQTQTPDSINSRNINAANNHQEYGRDIANDVHTAMLCLHLNWTDQEKMPVLIGLVQLAIDIWSRAEEGGEVLPIGGGNQWKKSVLCMAAACLGQKAVTSGLAAYCNALSPPHPPYLYPFIFAEDGQIRRLNGLDIVVARTAPSVQTVYQSYMVGAHEFFEGGHQLGNSGSQWTAEYRDVFGNALIGGMLAVRLTTGAEALWNNPGVFTYIFGSQRHREIGRTTGANTITPFVRNMLAAYYEATTSPPAIASSFVRNSQIVVRFDRSIDELADPPAIGDFTVKVNGNPVTITAVNPPWRTNYGLQLAAPVSGNDVVTLSYTPGASPIRSTDGVNAAALSDFVLPNITPKIGGPNAAFPRIRLGGRALYRIGVGTLSATNSAQGTVAFRFRPRASNGFFILSDSNQRFQFEVLADGRVRVYLRSASRFFRATSITQLVTDGSVEYEIAYSWDVTQATIASGFDLWINGVRETSFSQTLEWLGGTGAPVQTSLQNGIRVGQLPCDVLYLWMMFSTRINLATTLSRFSSLTSGDLDILSRGDGINGAVPNHFLVGNADQWNDPLGFNRGSGPAWYSVDRPAEQVSGNEWI